MVGPRAAMRVSPIALLALGCGVLALCLLAASPAQPGGGEQSVPPERDVGVLSAGKSLKVAASSSPSSTFGAVLCAAGEGAAVPVIGVSFAAGAWPKHERGLQALAFSPDVLAAVLWQDRLARGHFKTPPYTTSRNELLPSGHEFILVLNPGRGLKRKTKEPLAHVSMPFDPSTFNFHRASEGELLFFFRPSSTPFSETDSPLAALTGGAMTSACLSRAELQPHDDIHPFFINPFPLGTLSGLLVPFMNLNHSQVMRPELMRIGLLFAATLTLPDLRMGYNSLGAGASVNHFHFQIWQCSSQLPIEKAQVQETSAWQPRGRPGSVRVSRSTDFPLHFLRFDYTPDVLEEVVATLTHCMAHLVERNIPHNMVFTASAAFIVPRQPMEQWRSMTPGFPEMVGQLFTVQESDFTSITGQELQSHWESHIDVGEDTFAGVLSHCRSLQQSD